MKTFKNALLLLAALTVLTGAIYPALVTVGAELCFPRQASGSLIHDPAGQVIGSELIGQNFTAPGYFWPRPSATGDFPYNPLASGGSNLSLSNQAWQKQVQDRVEALRRFGNVGNLPADLVMASGSGLDPDISLDAALVQVPRIAQARNISPDAIIALLGKNQEKRQFELLGRERVNVLKLNLALDRR